MKKLLIIPAIIFCACSQKINPGKCSSPAVRTKHENIINNIQVQEKKERIEKGSAIALWVAFIIGRNAITKPDL